MELPSDIPWSSSSSARDRYQHPCGNPCSSGSLSASVTGLFEPSPLIDLAGPKSSVSVTRHVSFGLIFSGEGFFGVGFWILVSVGLFCVCGVCLFVCLIFFCNQNNGFFPSEGEILASVEVLLPCFEPSLGQFYKGRVVF